MPKASLVSYGLFPSSSTTTRWQKWESIAYDASPTESFTVLLDSQFACVITYSETIRRPSRT